MSPTSGRSLPARGNIPEVDGLRGLAIAVVLLHRFWPRTGPLARFDELANLGWTGVDLFFTISGFLIAGILLDTKRDQHYFRNFYARRVVRIFPLYYAYLAVVFVAASLRENGPWLQSAFLRSSGSPLWYVLYLGNVPEALAGKDPPFLLGMLWSLAIEEQFYLTFPWLASRLSRRWLVRVLLGLTVAAPLVRVATMVAFPTNERVQYLLTPCRIDVIALGCLLAVAVRSPSFRPSARVVQLAAVGMALLLAIVVAASGLDRTRPFGRTLGYSVVALSAVTSLLWVVASRGLRATALLRNRPLMYAGKICYGLYVLHRACGAAAARVFAQFGVIEAAGGALLLCAQFACTLIVATVSWYAFESPINRLKRRFASARHPAASAFASTAGAPSCEQVAMNATSAD